jgi:uncharacterized metal-binding protein
MANHIAVKMDRRKVAEMSCIAGVGGDVKPLVRTAKSGRPIVALDGCPLHCAAQILKRHGLQADKHYDLSKMGVSKKYHEDFDPAEAVLLLDKIAADVKNLGQPAPPPAPVDREDAPEPSSPVCYAKEFPDY